MSEKVTIPKESYRYHHPLCQYGKVSFKENPTWCTIYLQYISSNISTCFGCIYSPSSGGTPYVCCPGYVGTQPGQQTAI